MAEVYAREFRLVAQAQLLAVASRDAARAQEFAATHDIPRFFGSYGELLADDDIDVVYIATPHPQHRDIALAAIEHRKAVVVEKSFTATYAGAKQVVAAAREAGVFCVEGMWTRYQPIFQVARDIVAWGRIGDVLGVQGDLCAHRGYDPDDRLFKPELGGGALLDLGVYVVSFAQAFLGEADQIKCVGRYAPNGVDHAANISLRYRNGGLGSLSCGFDALGPGRMAIFGTRGWIDIEPRFHHATTLRVHRNGLLPRVIEAKLTGKGYTHQISAVSDLVAAGALESSTMPLSDTLEVMRVLQSCLSQLGVTHQEAAVVL